MTAALTAQRRLDRLGIVSLFLGMVEAGRVRVITDAKAGSWVPGLEYTRIEDGFPMSEVVRTEKPRFITSPRSSPAATPSCGRTSNRSTRRPPPICR